MILAALTATLAVVAGTGIGLLSSSGGRAAGPLHTFAIVTAVAVVLGQLLPDAMSVLGLPALLVFGAGFGLPRLMELVPGLGDGHGHGHGHGQDHAHSHGHANTHDHDGDHAHVHAEDTDAAPCSDVGLELGYIGLLVHRVGDGMGLALYSGGAHAGHGHYDVILAIAGHTVPVTALIAIAYKARRGVPQTLLRMGGVIAATAVGMVLTGALDDATIAAWEPWIEAAVAGLLMHVVSHGWQRPTAPTFTTRLMDLAALGVAALLVTFGGHDHAAEHGVDLKGEMAAALWRLGQQAAPMLLLGLLAAALLQATLGRASERLAHGGTRLGQALFGAAMGARMPLCACGIVPTARSLRTTGGSAALVVSFLLATPELGLETFALTVRFFGLPFALLRLVASLAFAILGAYVLSRLLGESGSPPPPASAPSIPPAHDTGEGDGLFRRIALHFDGLLYHVGAWTLIGLLVAAYIDATVHGDGLRGLASAGLDVPLVSLLAVPAYVCAPAATPLAAVLLAKGVSHGAVLAGLVLGPATNLASVRFLRSQFGTGRALLALGLVVIPTWALAYGVNRLQFTQLGAPVPLPTALETGCAVALCVLLARSVWYRGLRGFLASLAEG